jgi:tol-pal system protein YbgF
MMVSILRKNGLCRVGLCFSAFLLFPSCVATHRDVGYLNDQIAAVNTRIDTLEKSMGGKLSSDLDVRLQSIRESQAELGAEVDQVRTEIQELSGRLEENSHLIKRTIERDTTEQDVMKASLPHLTRRFAELETRVKRIDGYLGFETSRAVKGQDLKKGSLETKFPAQPPPARDKEPMSSAADLYDNTMASYREGKYEEAVHGFRNFLEKYPTLDLADNAQFWIGECYMAQRQYEQAILAYQKVIKKYPQGNKVPSAMLRQGQAFYQIKDKISSRLLFKKVIKEYPNSSEAKIAETKLKTIK